MAAEQSTEHLSAFQRMGVVTLVSTLVLVALGGAVRATDSGLACPDWPRCYGMWIPPADLHMWLEHSHRLVAGAVGIMVAVLLVWSLLRFRHRPDVVLTTAVAAVLVVVQAALGAVVVLRLLQAELVTAHLGMAMLVVACLAILVEGAASPQRLRLRGGHAGGGRARRSPGLAPASLAVAALCYAQLLVGAHVTGINAGLAFRDFPLMGGAILPAITSERELFHATHRFLALALTIAVVLLVVHARRERAARLAAGEWVPPRQWLVRLPWLALGLVAVQVVLGVANLYNETSWVTVIPHLAVGSWIWTVLVFQTLLAYRYAPTAGATVHGAVHSPEESRA